MDNDLVTKLRNKIDSATNIQIISHIRPDGDAISSIIAFGLALIEVGKQVQMISSDGVPTALRYLPDWNQINKKISEPVDLIIALDCADRERLGSGIDSETNIDVCIDHHITNTNFADLNLVVPDAVATCAILARLIPELGIQITPSIAEALLVGILADSQGFRTLNTNAEALRTAADIVELGANLPDLYFRTLVNRSFEATRYWGAGLGKLQSDNGVVWTRLSLDDRKKANYHGKDDADLINVLSAINEMQIAVIFVEQDPQKVKVSWRGSDGVDVASIAAQFGGGGHVAAAGAMIEGTLDEVQKIVIKTTQKIFEQVSEI
ncbi:MAG: DHH family phosphoesterase [Chloroflexota bacterium]